MQNSGADNSNSTEDLSPAFMDMLEKREDPDLIAVARRLIEWAGGMGLDLRWSTAREVPLFAPAVQTHIGEFYFVEVTAKGRVDILFDRLMEIGPFRDEQTRMEVLRRLNAITGLSMPDFTISRRPNFSLSALANDAAFGQFTSTCEWVVSRLRE